jgi:hypothetical protein
MIETPAAALTAPELARYADFFSIGTNDLVQYTLAVDRGNARWRRSTTRSTRPSCGCWSGRRGGARRRHRGQRVRRAGGNPLGVFLLLGLGINALSVAPSSLPEVKKVVRSVPAWMRARREPRCCARHAGRGHRHPEGELSRWLDLSLFSGRWNLPPGGGADERGRARPRRAGISTRRQRRRRRQHDRSEGAESGAGPVSNTPVVILQEQDGAACCRSGSGRARPAPSPWSWPA